MNPEAVNRREAARKSSGEFGVHARSTPDIVLGSGPSRMVAEVKHISSQVAGSSFPSELTTINEVTGILKKRVQARFGATRGRVYLEERVWEGGHSEWTAENGQEFTVRLGDQDKTFYPDHVGDGFVQSADAPAYSRDSVYARFERWLQAGERPEELFFEAFESAGDGYNLYPESPLFEDKLRVWNRDRRAVGRVTLRPMPQVGHAGWYLVGWSAENKRVAQTYVGNMDDVVIASIEDIGRLMRGVTDIVCVGRESPGA